MQGSSEQRFQMGEVVVIRDGNFAGIFVVIAPDYGDSRVDVARLGGDKYGFVRARREQLERVDSVPLYAAIGKQLAQAAAV